jgi:hypothetical protein
MADSNRSFQPRNNRSSPAGRDRGNRKRFFGFGRKRKLTPEESNAESLDRQQSSENAKKVIESFEEDTKSYRHGPNEGKLSQSLSFYIILGLAVAAVVVTLVLLFLKKGA